ncbi:MAG: hypothetical protein ISEC1_P1068 [Thiomicrorhabdus sp.]|nr:MAG: hypothetical protein ISEC1_P1068 [Thiomicrorhabdus sp.]
MAVGLTTLSLGLMVTFFSVNAIAQVSDNSELDDALSGFDEPVSGSSDLDDALSGFDEPASGSDVLDDVLSGFDEAAESNQSAAQQARRTLPSPLQIKGQLSFKNAYAYQESAPVLGNADYSGLTKTQFAALIKMDYKFSPAWKAKAELKGFFDSTYSMKGRDNYNQDSLDTYESELEINEAYIAGTLSDDWDLKFGRQIVVWGKSDSIRINDVINPLDNRELGMVDIEDLRLPVMMTRLDYYQGDWQVSLLAQHEHRNPKEAAINSEYFPTDVLPMPPGMSFPDIADAGFELDETTLSVAANGRFSGWDLSLYAGRFQDGRWHFIENKTAREYSLINMAGFAVNKVEGSWLLKTELAVLNDLYYNTVTEKQTRYDLLMGLEYKGITDTTLSLEVADRYLPDHQFIMESMPDAVLQHNLQTAVRALYSFDHDRAMLGYLGQYFGQQFEQGGFHRIWLDYELTSDVTVISGVIDYFGGENQIFEAMKNNDKLFVDFKLYF